ncbi:MAG: hypothetical protein FWG13_00445, partial [Leptospirales bacterium]|nr:hypothetical protein [Leptospirales bacterium]
MKILKTTAALLFVLTTAVQTFAALNVTVTPPQVSGGADLQGAADSLANNIISELSNINAKPKKFTKANANAASFANHAATQRGYTDYDYFALTVGAMVGGQLPTFSSNELKGLDSTIENEGDAEIGFSAQFAVQLGIKAWFISDDLYLGLKVGKIKFNFDPNDENKFEYDTFMLGLVGNYMLFNKTSIGFGSIRWRGVNFGTGLIYQSSDTKYMMKIDDVSDGSNSLNVTNPYLNYKMNSKIVTIPLELTTALRLLYCTNFTVGFGADLAMGKTDVKFGMDGDLKLTGTGTITTP